MLLRFLTILLLFVGILVADPIRHKVEIDGEEFIFYLEMPEGECEYPLMVAIEGSYVAKVGPESVLRLHRKLSQQILESGIGLVTMERRGVDGKNTNCELFHYFNTPSQRLADHIRLVEYLQEFPPRSWNGQFIFPVLCYFSFYLNLAYLLSARGFLKISPCLIDNVLNFE